MNEPFDPFAPRDPLNDPQPTVPPLPDPAPVEDVTTTLSDGAIIYWSPITGDAYVIDPVDQAIPGIDEWLRANGLVPYDPTGNSPNANDKILQDAYDPADGDLLQRVYEDRQAALQDGSAGIARSSAIRDISYLEGELARTNRAYALKQQAEDIARARTKQASRFAEALRFNGQEYWRERQRKADAALSDALSATQQESATAAIQNRIANAGDDIARADNTSAMAGLYRQFSALDFAGVLDQSK